MDPALDGVSGVIEEEDHEREAVVDGVGERLSGHLEGAVADEEDCATAKGGGVLWGDEEGSL